MALRDEKQAASVLGCSDALLRRMRRENRGPRWTKVGRLVRYADEWLSEYIEKNAVPAGNDRREPAATLRAK
jgi:predicted DNA-binding transcriptional regulator AlpA